MVFIRKHRRDDEEVSGSPPRPSEPPSMLTRVRNMWQFACLCQWLYIFGGLVKLEVVDIDELEAKCLSSHSTALQDIGLALLKYLSSYRGLTHDLFDEYTRRQFVSKAPELPNPFGTDKIPLRFSDFTVFQKIRVLHQMTLFIMMNPEKLREKMSEQKDADRDQTAWRIEPFGWDRYDRIYYVLDDNRVYRLMETPTTLPKMKKDTKKGKARAKQNSKRRIISSGTLNDSMKAAEDNYVAQADEEPHHANYSEGDDDGSIGAMKWECVAVSLDDLHCLLDSIPGKKDPNERILHDKIVEHLLPILEHQEERRKRREKERERELLNLAKMATAKRSSRIANRHEQQKQDENARDEEQKRLVYLDALRKEEQKRRKTERERENRFFSREKRLQERQVRRLRHEEELAHLFEDSKSLDNTTGRMSKRRRFSKTETPENALQELAEEGDEEWVFDCICGLHGKVDDGQHSVSCEKCNIWQHSRCLGISEEEAEKDDFHFLCRPCEYRAEAVSVYSASGSAIKTNAGKSVAEPDIRTSSPSAAPTRAPPPAVEAPRPYQVGVDIPEVPPSKEKSMTLVPALPPVSANSKEPQSTAVARAGIDDSSNLVVVLGSLESQLHNGKNDGPIKEDGPPYVPKLGPVGEVQPQMGPVSNSFSVPHSGLSHSDQPPHKSHAYGTICEEYSPAPHISITPRPEQWAEVHPRFSTQTSAPKPSIAPGSARQERMQVTPTSLATPRLQHCPGYNQITIPDEPFSSPLLAYNGLSPTKHSPTIAKNQTGGLGTSLTPRVFPPAAALSPSAPEQIFTPPVKPEGMAHRQSFSVIAADIGLLPKEDTGGS